MLRYILIFLFFNSLCYNGKAELAIFDKFVKYILINKNVQTQLFAFDVEYGLDVLRGIHEDIVDELVIYWSEFPQILNQHEIAYIYNVIGDIVKIDNDNNYYWNVKDIINKFRRNTGHLFIPTIFYEGLSKF
ncbi:unnamed protein product [Meloidogyne enterolobii]|uniref:Uncharacterized protein n=2 Tax=Meloidogyne enterolobii TaxID=390850 RepID=A0ACB1B4C4_MELEN